MKIRRKIDASPADVSDRLSSRIKPLGLEESFEKSLNPRGTIVGTVVDSYFTLQESMYGYGGATASGTITGTGNETMIEATLQPGLFMRFGFAILSIVYVVVCYLFFDTVCESGLSIGRSTAFLAYTLLFTGAWYLMIKEMKDLAKFLMDVGSG